MKIVGSGPLKPALWLSLLFALFHALIWARTGYFPGASTGDDQWFSESAYYLLSEGALRRPMHDDELGSLNHDFLPPLTNLVQAGMFLVFGIGQFGTNAQSSLWCLAISILVFAMVLIPASTAYQLTHSLTHMTAYSVGIGIVCATGGVMLSYLWDLPASPAIVLLATTIFFLSVLLSPKRLRRAGLAAS